MGYLDLPDVYTDENWRTKERKEFVCLIFLDPTPYMPVGTEFPVDGETWIVVGHRHVTYSTWNVIAEKVTN